MGIQRERRQVKGIGNIFDKIIAENCKNLETEMRLLDNTRKCHIIVKTLGIQNKERLLKAVKEKSQSHIKANPSE
jgi:hypothetical protein